MAGRVPARRRCPADAAALLTQPPDAGIGKSRFVAARPLECARKRDVHRKLGFEPRKSNSSARTWRRQPRDQVPELCCLQGEVPQARIQAKARQGLGPVRGTYEAWAGGFLAASFGEIPSELQVDSMLPCYDEFVMTDSAYRHGFKDDDFVEMLRRPHLVIRNRRGRLVGYEVFCRNRGGL